MRIRFSEPIGTSFHATWLNASVLAVDILDATGAGDPTLTRPGVLSIVVYPTGDVRRAGNVTQPSSVTTPTLLTIGSWGAQMEPIIESVVAGFTNLTAQESGDGPTKGDYMIVTFREAVDIIVPATTQAQVDSLLVMDPPVTDVDYVGQYDGGKKLVEGLTHFWHIVFLVGG